MSYPNVNLYIDGAWRAAAAGNRTLPVLNPATEEVIGTVAHAEKADLDGALAAAREGLRGLAQGLGLRALQDDAQGRRHLARPRRRRSRR